MGSARQPASADQQMGGCMGFGAPHREGHVWCNLLTAGQERGGEHGNKVFVGRRGQRRGRGQEPLTLADGLHLRGSRGIQQGTTSICSSCLTTHIAGTLEKASSCPLLPTQLLFPPLPLPRPTPFLLLMPHTRMGLQQAPLTV